RTVEAYECRILALELKDTNLYDVTSVARHDLGVELGPQSHGVVRAENVERMRKIVQTALDFVEMFNKGVEFPECELDIYRHVRNVDFPRDVDGEICAVIHPERQDRDWLPLRPGDPIFLTLAGRSIPFDGDRTVHPIFINESAYYEKRTAFSVTERVRVRLPPIRRDREGEGASQ
ncbi:aspartoacylase-like, partial [Mustelus asterias]